MKIQLMGGPRDGEEWHVPNDTQVVTVPVKLGKKTKEAVYVQRKDNLKRFDYTPPKKPKETK